MGRFDKFKANPIEVTINGEVFKIKPLKVGDMPLAMQMESQDPEKRGEALKRLILKTLKDNFPEETEESLLDMRFDFLEPILKAIGEVHGISVEESKKSMGR